LILLLWPILRIIWTWKSCQATCSDFRRLVLFIHYFLNYYVLEQERRKLKLLGKEDSLIRRLGYKTSAIDTTKMDVKTEFSWEKSFRETYGCRRENKERLVPLQIVEAIHEDIFASSFRIYTIKGNILKGKEKWLSLSKLWKPLSTF
jgi:hypothetical protein